VYGALHAMGWARSADPLEAGGELCGARITNAVKCVPPQNKPTPEEQRTCRDLWLRAELADGPARVFVAFGAIAHDALLALAGAPRSAHPFAHGAEHRIVLGDRPRVLLDSFHPSPLNTQTGKLSRAQFHAVFTRAKALVDTAAREGT
jgi:uracil-DNA glycosylase family 4